MESNQGLILIHGSNNEVRTPDLSRSREDVDFGAGFYLTKEFDMAAKWACRKKNSVCNTYSLDLTGLKVHVFKLDKEWLDYVVANRNLENIDFPAYDVLVGPIADDKLYNTLEMYEDGYISAEQAVEIMNCMKYGNQYVLKTQKAVNQLQFVESKELYGADKNHYRRIFKQDKETAAERTSELLREFNGR